MAWTSADLEAARTALLNAITTGKSVVFADRSWTSHDLPRLRELVADMERAVNATSGASTSRLAAFRKGTR